MRSLFSYLCLIPVLLGCGGGSVALLYDQNSAKPSETPIVPGYILHPEWLDIDENALAIAISAVDGWVIEKIPGGVIMFWEVGASDLYRVKYSKDPWVTLTGTLLETTSLTGDLTESVPKPQSGKFLLVGIGYPDRLTQVASLASGLTAIYADFTGDGPRFQSVNSFVSAGAARMSAGEDHTCAIDRSDVLCWGKNDTGQLGTGFAIEDEILLPEKVVSVTGSASMVKTSSNTTCAVAGGGIQCWGRNHYGQLGLGDLVNRYLPETLEIPGIVESVDLGEKHGCAIVSGEVWCWGRNEDHQLGTDIIELSTLPIKVEGLSGVTMLAAGSKHNCALLGSGQVWCWGSNSSRQLGPKFSDNDGSPVRIEGIGKVTSIDAGSHHNCALVEHELWCWGRNKNGQLGTETVPASDGDLESPVPVKVQLEGEVTAFAATKKQTCAVADGVGWCWGDNDDGQLGEGDRISRRVIPEPVVGLALGVTSFTLGHDHTCAELDGKMLCWGRNSAGQLGVGTERHKYRPVSVGMDLSFEDD